MAGIVNVSCTRVRFQPGDRVLVRCYRPLTPGQRERLMETVRRWAGVPVEVLVYDAALYEIEVEHGRGTEGIIAG